MRPASGDSVAERGHPSNALWVCGAVPRDEPENHRKDDGSDDCDENADNQAMVTDATKTQAARNESSDQSANQAHQSYAPRPRIQSLS